MDGSPGPVAGLGVGVSVEKPNPTVFTVDKRKGSSSPHQLFWLEASGKVLGHLNQALFRGRKVSKQVAACTPPGWGPVSTPQAPLLADSKLPTSKKGTWCRTGGGG